MGQHFRFEGDTMQNQHRSRMAKNLFSAVTIFLSIGILTFFLVTEDGMKSLERAVSELQPVWLLWILAGVLAGWFLEGYVLHLFCRHLDQTWTFGKSFYIGMVELFYSALAPFGMGEPMEVYRMTKLGMETGAATSIVAVKSLVHHGVTFVYSFFLIAFELNYFRTKVSNFAIIAVFGLITNSIFIVFVLMFMMNERLTDSILRVFVRFMDKIKLHKLSQKFYDQVHGQLMVFHDSSRIFGKNYMLYLVAVLFTVVQITVASLISYFVYRSFNLKGESVFIMVAADTFVTMAASFIPLPGSSGGAEGGFYLFFREFFGPYIIPGITLWRFSTYYLNILLGSILVYFGAKRYSSD